MPNYKDKSINIVRNVTQVPFLKNQRISSILERIGIYEDYLDTWVDTTFDYLKSKIKKEDIIFSTSGGELGMIKLGSVLKNEIGCKLVINFHDPLVYSLVNGLKLDNKFHVNREEQEFRYLQNSDLIISSSKSNQISLCNKYPNWNDKIKNNYFGYIHKIDLTKYGKKSSNKLKIAYVGSMGLLQKPEILYNLYRKLKNKNIEIYFIGNINSYSPLQNISDKNVKFIDFMPHDEFLKFMVENIDIGFVSLVNDYLGACVPSKLYEYLNLGLPMIGALPDGDGKNIINDNGYGVACRYDDINGLITVVEKFTDDDYLNNIKLNIIKNRHKWSMDERINDVNTLLKKVQEFGY